MPTIAAGRKILVGEWATREGSPTTNLGAALGDAAWMTGLERNSDIVVMASYAPLFVNVNPGGMQWPSDLIGYDAMNSYGSPSDYAQVLFSTHLGDQILDARLDTTNPRLFDAATYDSKTHRLHLKLVNASSLPQRVAIKLSGAAHIRSQATVTTLRGNTTQETNSITDPNRIVPVAGNIAKCKYHVVFIPKVSQEDAIRGVATAHGGSVPQAGYTEGESNRKEGHLLPDQVHRMIAIPPKYAVSQVIGFIKGKSTIHLASVYGERKRNFVGQHFWARGYFVSTVGRDEKVIRAYIQHQEQEDKRLDQMNLGR